MTRISGFVIAATLAAAPLAVAQDLPPQAPPQAPPAQSPPIQQPPPVPTTPPAAAPAEVAKAPVEPMTRERFHARRNAIGIMEGALINTVQQSAKELMGQIKDRVGPVAGLLTGYARARGFFLEDYGVMFHVEIPGVQTGVLSLVEQMQRQQIDPRAERTGPAAAAFDIDAAYTETVKTFLINTMLLHSIGLDLDPGEWLTIAARDGGTPPPGAIYESITMVIRVRGADLADFHSKRISREDVLKRVQVRGF